MVKPSTVTSVVYTVLDTGTLCVTVVGTKHSPLIVRVVAAVTVIVFGAHL